MPFLDIILYMNNLFTQLMSPRDIQNQIAENMKAKRKAKKISQQDLSVKSGVSYGSIKRFENHGEISLQSLVKIAISLDCESDLLNLFSVTEYTSIQEVINENS